jgi:hypothetical protein
VAPAIHVPSTSLTLRAGPAALARLRTHGLRAEDIDIMPGASGGAKWLAIAGLDRFVFGELLQAPRTRPLHLIGSSIGSWRMACLAQRDPLAALARGHYAYIHEQQYSARPTTAEITAVLARALDLLLGAHGVEEILSHPTCRLHVITAVGRGLAASTRRPMLSASLALAAAGNSVSRRALALQFRRRIFHNAGAETPFAHLRDLPTEHVALTHASLRAALLASGSIPLLLDGVRVPGSAADVHWDGGVLDYHLDLDFGAGDGLVFYPHFYPHVVPGWFDKGVPWRRGRRAHFDRVLLVSPSASFVASLPGGKIPDRRDFRTFDHAERARRWQRTADESERLGDELRMLVTSGRLVDVVQPWRRAH